MLESMVMRGVDRKIRSEEEACEVFWAQIKHGLESVQKGRVFSVEEAWKEIDSI